MLIGAYYYAWYHDQWLNQTVRKNDPPSLGQYDNTKYGLIIDEHIKQMKHAGINFISISWQNNQFGYLLDTAKSTGIKITYLVESLSYANQKWRITPETMPKLIDDLQHVKDDMDEDCWLRIDGRPVLMLYVTRNYDKANIILEAIRKEIPDVFLVGDEYFWESVPDGKIQLLDAATAYNMYQSSRFTKDNACETYLSNCRSQMQNHANQCKRLNKPLWGNAMPGYNDSGVRPNKQHPEIPREDGSFFRQSILDAKESSVLDQALMITSFNEWFEDTQIESSQSYGNLYLDILKDLSK